MGASDSERESGIEGAKEAPLQAHLARWKRVGGKVKEVSDSEAVVALNEGRYCLHIQVGDDGQLYVTRK